MVYRFRKSARCRHGRSGDSLSSRRLLHALAYGRLRIRIKEMQLTQVEGQTNGLTRLRKHLRRHAGDDLLVPRPGVNEDLVAHRLHHFQSQQGLGDRISDERTAGYVNILGRSEEHTSEL